MILDEPTKGVDIQTRQVIMPRCAVWRGAAVIVISSDFQELLGLAHRIVVISDGRSVADMPSSLLNEETLTLLAARAAQCSATPHCWRPLVQDYGGAGFGS